MEEIRDDVKVLAEMQIAMGSNIESLVKGQELMKEDISIIKGDIVMLKSDVSTLKSDVSSIKSELAEFKDDTKQSFKIITEYLMRLEDEIVELKKELRGVKDGSIPISSVVSIDERLVIVEKSVAELKAVQA